jgi:hypothetical protein
MTRLCGAVGALRAASRSAMTPIERAEYDREVEAAGAAMAPADWEAAGAMAMSMEQAIAYATM